MIIANGHFTLVPLRSPHIDLVYALATYEAAGHLSNARELQRSVVKEMKAVVEKLSNSVTKG